MTQENFPKPEQFLPPEPSLETQRALLTTINGENAQQLLESGIVEKAQTTVQKKISKPTEPLFAYSAPEAVDEVIDQYAERGLAELERSLDPYIYTVNHQMVHDMTEFYSITYDHTLNILVGHTEVDADGRICLVPARDFTSEDLELVKRLVDDLVERKVKGELPDLTSDLQYIYNPDKEIAQ